MDDCPTCAESIKQINAIEVALVVLLAVVIVFYITGRIRRTHRESFVSGRARHIYSKAAELFGKESDATFSQFKTAVGTGDITAVAYHDIRKLWEEGRLTPETVDQVI